jgi:hypothetical protein
LVKQPKTVLFNIFMVSEQPKSQRSSMADSSSNSASFDQTPNPITEISPYTHVLPNITQLVGIKLEGSCNYLGWVAQFQPILCGYELEGLIDGTDPCPPKLIPNPTRDAEILNPTYVAWRRRDQQLLSLIICSIAPSLVSSMYGLKTSQLAWNALATKFAAQSRSRISNLKRQLQSLQQGSK